MNDKAPLRRPSPIGRFDGRPRRDEDSAEIAAGGGSMIRFPDDPLLGVRATILLRIDWLSGLIGALLW